MGAYGALLLAINLLGLFPSAPLITRFLVGLNKQATYRDAVIFLLQHGVCFFLALGPLSAETTPSVLQPPASTPSSPRGPLPRAFAAPFAFASAFPPFTATAA
jgi:hypothetical protein